MTTEHKVDCTHFNGFKPCDQHKKFRTECSNCTVYKPISYRILIIKTGAAGDVIRTTPILRRLKKEYPDAEITWITLYPDFVPEEAVNKVLLFNWENCLALTDQKFNLIISLDKSLPEATLASKIQHDECWGFISDKNGKILPANKNAFNKWDTGIDDVAMLKNKKHFVEELFEICGWIFNGETYWLSNKQLPTLDLKTKKQIVGLNTGCGERWITRLWPAKNFTELSRFLISQGYEVILLGGPAEDEKNKTIAAESGANYFGVMPLTGFVSLISRCDVIVSSVTMALHIAIGLQKRIVLLNNIFPSSEFHLYGLGKILEPNLSCQSCFKGAFDKNCLVDNCLSLIKTTDVFNEIQNQFLELKKNITTLCS